ncbi:MAG: site-specific integrase [Ignavibacteriales bacterium]|nr:site-specific integrase [Ignavibacteriales bacterium]
MYLIKRNKIFHLFYKDENGKETSISTKCTTKAEANKFLQDFTNSPKIEESKHLDLTFEQFESFYSKYATTRFTPSYQEFVCTAFSQFNRVISSSIPIRNIKTANVEAFISLKLTEAKARIINGYLRTLQAAFQRAVEFNYLKENVFAKVRKLKFAENKPIFLQAGEFDKIYEVEEDAQLKSVYTMAIYTGMRLSEIRYIRWDAIDFSTNVINVQNHNEFTTKSKRSRVIPIHPKLMIELLGLRDKKNNEEYVFMRNGTVIRDYLLTLGFKRAVRAAKLNDVYHFHTLRHSFASTLVQKGVSIFIVSKLLGHADIKTTMIYSHLRTEDLRGAVETLDLG